MDIVKALKILENEYHKWSTPAVTILAQNERNPFKVLISCIISLRTKDEVTAKASLRLFTQANTPKKMQLLPVDTIANLIYPAGFYRTKAAQIHEICKLLVENYGESIPDEIDELLKFKGVGRKTANLVLTLGYGKQGICVDTHVHRICNRWGYVSTKNAEQTEMALRNKLPPKYWIRINDLLVAFGQNCCNPVSPKCSSCSILPFCPRIGVSISR